MEGLILLAIIAGLCVLVWASPASCAARRARRAAGRSCIVLELVGGSWRRAA